MEACFLESAKGKIFCQLFRPPGKVKGKVILFPPFAEELNKSRKMLSEQARSLASNGHGVMLVDLFGTGDSEGDFVDADWSTWLNDMHVAIVWLNAQLPGKLSFWGVRTGALLSVDYSNRFDPAVHRLVFWQAQLNGRQIMSQFLRLKLAGSFVKGDGKVTSNDLKQEMENQGSLEIAGYTLSRSLYNSINGLNTPMLKLSEKITLDLLDISPQEIFDTPPARNKVTRQWSDCLASHTYSHTRGASFWSTQEIVMLPELISKTTALFSE